MEPCYTCIYDYKKCRHTKYYKGWGYISTLDCTYVKWSKWLVFVSRLQKFFKIISPEFADTIRQKKWRGN